MNRTLSLLLLALPLAANAAPCSTDLKPADFQSCWEARVDASEQRLETLLNDLRKTLTAKNWDRLKTSQVLWEKSRDLDCKIPGSFEEKAYETSVRYQCEDELTQQRIFQLRIYLCPRFRHTGTCDAPQYSQ